MGFRSPALSASTSTLHICSSTVRPRSCTVRGGDVHRPYPGCPQNGRSRLADRRPAPDPLTRRPARRRGRVQPGRAARNPQMPIRTAVASPPAGRREGRERGTVRDLRQMLGGSRIWGRGGGVCQSGRHLGFLGGRGGCERGRGCGRGGRAWAGGRDRETGRRLTGQRQGRHPEEGHATRRDRMGAACFRIPAPPPPRSLLLRVAVPADGPRQPRKGTAVASATGSTPRARRHKPGCPVSAPRSCRRGWTRT